jgi:hypothetical protein
LVFYALSSVQRLDDPSIQSISQMHDFSSQAIKKEEERVGERETERKKWV